MLEFDVFNDEECPGQGEGGGHLEANDARKVRLRIPVIQNVESQMVVEGVLPLPLCQEAP